MSKHYSKQNHLKGPQSFLPHCVIDMGRGGPIDLNASLLWLGCISNDQFSHLRPSSRSPPASSGSHYTASCSARTPACCV
ncbi:hypothetical protein FKM82_017234 [Ascaphus truei]